MLFRHALRVPLAAASLTTLAVFGLGGCDSGGDANPASDTGPSVLVPGKPGEANQTLSAKDAEERRAEDDSPNSADIAYARTMIEHHTQALKMTELAPARAESAKLKALAERIAAAQGPEIAAMEAWLTEHGEDAKGDSHQHATMPGIATEAQLKKLRAAKSEAFDELFLTLMITHHEGAITMATDVKAQGNNIRIEEMADDVVAQQASEITRMRDMQ